MTAGADLVTALRTARSSVFRLEGHQDYPDDELWQAHLRGEAWEQDPELADWCSLVSATVARGVSWTRVRVVTEPWTLYTQWEIEQHYPHNRDAGEDIRFIRTPGPWPLDDFWLVDDERAWLLFYDPHDTMIVTETNQRSLPVLRTFRDKALRLAKAPATT